MTTRETRASHPGYGIPAAGIIAGLIAGMRSDRMAYIVAWSSDTRLSHRARGVVAYMLAVEPCVTLDRLAAQSAEPRGAIRSALRELEELGYIERVSGRAGNGQFGHVFYQVNVRP